MEKNISYYEHESQMARMERVTVRLWVLVIILIIALIGTNAGWFYYEAQFEDTVITQEAQSDGNSDINLQNVGGDYYGR